MAKMAGLIFADSNDADMRGLLNKRSMAAIPFGAHYRLIDFPLSNLTNAGAKNIGVIVKTNYQSLMGHVASGTAWDLDRKKSGLWILPPYSTETNTDTMYKNRLEGLIANRSFIGNLTEEYLMITGTSFVANLDFRSALKQHIKSGKSISLLYSKDVLVADDGARKVGITLTEDGLVDQMVNELKKPEGMVYGINSYIMKTSLMLDIIDEAIVKHQSSFRNDVLLPMAKRGEINAIGVDGPVMFVDTMASYLKTSLLLLEQDVRTSLFHSENGPIITKDKDIPPAKYGPNAHVENSIIGDGAVINGTVRNSVIFRGVRIEEGAVVDHSVVMRDGIVSVGAELDYTILDKYSTIQPGRRLSGYITHPFLLERNGRI